MSRAGFARFSLVAESTLSAIETGRTHDVLLSSLIKIAAATGCSPDYLLGYDQDGHVRRLITATSIPIWPPPSGNPLRLVQCPCCDSPLKPGVDHSLGACILALYERPRSYEYLGQMFGITPLSIETIVREEYRIQRQLGPGLKPAS